MAISNTLKFYLDRAEDARKQAEAATLSHVRDRCRRSEAAWTELAGRAAEVEELRMKEIMRKSALSPE